MSDYLDHLHTKEANKKRSDSLKRRHQENPSFILEDLQTEEIKRKRKEGRDRWKRENPEKWKAQRQAVSEGLKRYHQRKREEANETSTQ